MQNNSFRFGPVLSSSVVYRSKPGFPFMPGLFLIALGLLVVFAPRLFISAIAAFFVFLGIILCVVAWKISQFKRQLRSMASEMEAKMKAEEFQFKHPDIEVQPSDYKKIVFH